MDSAGKAGEDNEPYVYRHVSYAIQIIEDYSGAEPFHLFLKRYFSQNRKHGSRDRREISALCFNYFRLGGGVKVSVPLRRQILLGVFIMTDRPGRLLAKYEPFWNEKITEALPDKFLIVKDLFEPNRIFSFVSDLSTKMHNRAFQISFLQQPYLFLRLRKGKAEGVLQKLQQQGIHYTVKADDCLALPPSTPVGEFLRLNRDVVVQDLNSQKTGTLLRNIHGTGLKVWDCCAASGGKTILAFDMLDAPQITVSDIRQEILKNLDIRLRQAGILRYTKKVADLTQSSPFPPAFFDVIIADVPCSGSGTWARTPEQLKYFSPETIAAYAIRQRRICTNALASLRSNGYFLYITCSVFFKENEEQVEWLKANGLTLLENYYFEGYEDRADTLFAALLRKD